MADAIVSDSTRRVTGGVDTHKEIHVAVVVDQLGRRLGCESFPTTTAGYVALLGWMRGFGPIERVGVEGTGSWGAGLSRFLAGSAVTVIEVSRPDRQARRLAGKSDPVDAEAAAIAALSGRASVVPKSSDGPVEAIRMLRACRQSAVRDRTATWNQLGSLIDTAPAAVRDTFRGLPKGALIARACRSRPHNGLGDPVAAALYSARVLAKRWAGLDAQITELDAGLGVLVAEVAPNLVKVFGVGTHTAAALLICAGDNPDRVRSSAGFAALCGVTPIQASSGKTRRHRLNRGGNRQANNALWTIAMTRLAFDERTKTYAERRTAEGLSKREIIRCLKRAIARELFPIITTELNTYHHRNRSA